MGNPPLPGDTLAGGMTWAGHVTTQLNSSLTLTYDFAVSGATVDSSIVQPFAPGIPSVVDQVKTFKDNVAPKPTYAPWTAENALFFVWIGVNDVGNSYAQAGAATILNRDLDQLFAQLQILYDLGARNLVFMTVPRRPPRYQLLPRELTDEQQRRRRRRTWPPRLTRPN